MDHDRGLGSWLLDRPVGPVSLKLCDEGSFWFSCFVNFVVTPFSKCMCCRSPYGWVSHEGFFERALFRLHAGTAYESLLEASQSGQLTHEGLRVERGIPEHQTMKSTP